MNIFEVPIHIGRVDSTPEFERAFAEINLDEYARPVKEYNPFWLCDVNTSHGSTEVFTGQPWVKAFLNMILPTVADYVEPLAVGDVQIESKMPWVNVYRKGQNQDVHTHVANGNLLSYCYFHQVPDDAALGGLFYFVNSNGDKRAFGQEHETVLNIVQSKVVPKVANGSFVVFPAWLEHGVSTYLGDTPRITISGNLAIRRRSR